MLKEGRYLRGIAPNVAVKVPLTEAGLSACHALAAEGTLVNVTLCFSAVQAILAGKAGAAFVSPFVGRLDDIGQDGIALISDIVQIYRHYPAIRTEVLVASIRNPIHLLDSARIGAHVATVPPSVLKQLFKHPLTDRGLEAFLADWAKTGQSIL
jgi:transaldolase